MRYIQRVWSSLELQTYLSFTKQKHWSIQVVVSGTFVVLRRFIPDIKNIILWEGNRSVKRREYESVCSWMGVNLNSANEL